MLDTMSRQERRLLSREGTAWHIEVSHWCVLRRHIQGGTGTVLSAVDSFRTLWWRGVSCHVRADDAENARVVSSGVCNNAQSCSGICPWERNGTLSKRPLLLFRRCSAASQSLVSLLPGGVAYCWSAWTSCATCADTVVSLGYNCCMSDFFDKITFLYGWIQFFIPHRMVVVVYYYFIYF